MENTSWPKKVTLPRILQVNLSDQGGAFSLMEQVQRRCRQAFVFDYYSMGKFAEGEKIRRINHNGGEITNANLRRNRVLGHLCLPFHYYAYLKRNNGKYRVVHIHADTSWKLLLYAVPSRIARVDRIIIHAHASGVNGDFRVLKKTLHLLMKPLLPFFASIYVSCSFDANCWMYPSSIRGKAKIIKNGIDTNRFAYSETKRQEIRNEMHINHNCKVVGVITDYSYVKNTEYSIRVFAKTLKSTNAKLMIIGDGAEEAKYKLLAKQEGIEQDTLFVGRVVNVEDYLSAMDVFIMPSLSEGFPLSIIEAQSSGLKCIVSDRVSRAVNIIGLCEFIGVGEREIDDWVREIESAFSKERYMLCKEVNEAGYSVENTAADICTLYTEDYGN